MYIGITLNMRIVNALKDSPEKKTALQYLGRVDANKDLFIQQCKEQLEAEVTKEQIGFLGQIFRSYDLRMTVSGDKESMVDESPAPVR